MTSSICQERTLETMVRRLPDLRQRSKVLRHSVSLNKQQCDEDCIYGARQEDFATSQGSGEWRDGSTSKLGKHKDLSSNP